MTRIYKIWELQTEIWEPLWTVCCRAPSRYSERTVHSGSQISLPCGNSLCRAQPSVGRAWVIFPPSHSSTLNFTCYLAAHLLNSARSCCRSSQSTLLFTTQKNFVVTDVATPLLSHFSRSFMNMVRSTGPSTDPGGSRCFLLPILKTHHVDALFAVYL